MEKEKNTEVTEIGNTNFIYPQTERERQKGALFLVLGKSRTNVKENEKHF